MLIFIDESGDSGFQIQKGSTPFFVIALVIFDDPLEAEKASLTIKELRRKLKVSDLFEFKFNKANRKFKNEFFNKIKNFKYRIRAIVIDKQSIHSRRLRNHKEEFYNYVIMQVLKNNKGSIKHARLRFDKYGEKNIRDQLRVYLSRQLSKKKKEVFKDLKFVDSRQNTLIQLSDIIAGCIFAYYSGKDSSYLKLLKKSKKIEDIWEFK